MPNKPSISYTGQPSFPVDGLIFQSSAFTDPQGNGTFAAMEWRIAEVTDPTAPAYDPNERFKLEIDSLWKSGELTPFNNTIAISPGIVETGHAYRARAAA